MKNDYKNDYKNEKLEGFPLRVPSIIKTKMAEKAKSERRSLNTLIIIVLEDYLAKANKEAARTVVA